jgi:hypothetical protein
MSRTTPLLLLALAACSDVKETDDHDHGHEDLFTTVELAFTPVDGGDALVFSWSDPEVDGDPIVDPVVLPDGADHDHHHAEAYTLDVRFLNAAEEPAHDITPEIADEADQHQIFLTGSAVDGPATADNSDAVLEHAYDDADSNGLPIGLTNTITTLALGSGELLVTLRHMPPEDGQAVKTADAAETVAAGGFAAIGGDNDVQVAFAITVE